MSALEQTINGEVTNYTDAPPDLFPFDEQEKGNLRTCISHLQQTQQAAEREIAIASNQLQAYVYQLAVLKGVDLRNYEFNFEAGGFKRKA
jgi:uncharacterized protein involved in exopolysaccharide biosynthesis